MGKPGDPTARVMMTPVPAHLTTDDDQLTDAAGIGVGRYGAKAVLAVPGAGALLSTVYAMADRAAPEGTVTEAPGSEQHRAGARVVAPVTRLAGRVACARCR